MVCDKFYQNLILLFLYPFYIYYYLTIIPAKNTIVFIWRTIENFPIIGIIIVIYIYYYLIM